MKTSSINKIHDYLYEIPVSFKHGMRVPARIYASLQLIENMDNAVLDQLTNVCLLPGILKHALCMPDGHSGYGFPIGGVAAIDPDTGVISPGGIGFDINCGVRLMATSLTFDEVKPRLKTLVQALFNQVPSGVGSDGMVRLKPDDFDEAMILGARWAIQNGYGSPTDLDFIEENGCMKGADPRAVSDRARARGKDQAGSLGSGNHYLEIQVVKEKNIFDKKIAEQFGIVRDGQIMVMIHSGSRGFGHQIATDYLKRFLSVMGSKYGLSLPDRELACAPFYSDDGQNYYRAMNCAINYAFLNRQMMMHSVKNILCDIFKKSPEELGLRLVYDVCHNTAKLERHAIDGKEKEILIHRKGATRAFAPGMEGIPDRYRSTGQPVLIGGSMETGSYLLAGIPSGAEAFYSTCHGSGRVMSRHRAKSTFNGRELQKHLEEQGIIILTSSFPGLAEEAGGAYKNVDEVIQATEQGGLSRAVAKLLPIGNIKG
ncbi:MAG TPA: RtcB family protein [Spirochaetota bacterium]|nr:RtcB family protein [Spirochaetota bacterium]HPC39422.1 RtcB family protein [Spirochaetota bacterium]HPL17306.1 RtcB family protein [Spirochaetota bacterium]HQF06759.1 RtcB family protein [Spirochaetota bacterium]HQH95622.1 RtcB family protein [Spirochaetota bacterium]